MSQFISRNIYVNFAIVIIFNVANSAAAGDFNEVDSSKILMIGTIIASVPAYSMWLYTISEFF